MKNFKKITAALLVSTLSAQSLFAINGSSQILSQIAAQKRSEVKDIRVQTLGELSKIRQNLVIVQKNLESKEQSDYSNITGNSAALVAASSALLITLVSHQNLRSIRAGTDDGASGFALAFVSAPIALLGIGSSHILNLTDILMSKDANAESIKQQINATMDSLNNLKNSLKSDSDKQMVSDLMNVVSQVDATAKQEEKEETRKKILAASGLLMSALTTAALTTNELAFAFIGGGDKSKSVLMLGFAVSGILNALSGLTGEDKVVIIQKVKAAINSIDQTIKATALKQ
jgi:hypothetical protein